MNASGIYKEMAGKIMIAIVIAAAVIAFYPSSAEADTWNATEALPFSQIYNSVKDQDPEDNPVECTKTSGPDGLTLTQTLNPDNSVKLVYTWDNPVPGNYTVVTVCIAKYPQGNPTQKVFTDTLHVNAKPTITTTSLSNATENQIYSGTVSCNDPDGDIVSMSASGLPSHLQATDNGDGTLTISGTPGYDYVDHQTHGTQRTDNITITCSDGQAQVQKTLQLVTDDDNGARVITSEPTYTEIVAGNVYVKQIQWTDGDPEDTAANCELVNASSPRITVDRDTCEVGFFATNEDVGLNTYTIRSCDGFGSCDEVTDEVNVAPSLPKI